LNKVSGHIHFKHLTYDLCDGLTVLAHLFMLDFKHIQYSLKNVFVVLLILFVRDFLTYYTIDRCVLHYTHVLCVAIFKTSIDACYSHICTPLPINML